MVKKIPAIIPARGGSKGILKKNIKVLAGKPLIAWTIEAALNSKYISDVIVSTDDDEIAEISRNYGAQIPFMRPPELATDESIAIDTYLYTVEKLNSEYNKSIEEFVVLQPTSPLRNSKHINEAVKLFYNQKADSVVSLVESNHSPYWFKKITPKGKIKSLFEDKIYSVNRQQLPKTYLINGAILILKYNILKSTRSYYINNSLAYIMSQEESIDIDNIIDFKICEIFLSENEK
ncbi:MAG: acylneuraminate cytidylyltransferase family protein [Ignavibacterium sp.]